MEKGTEIIVNEPVQEVKKPSWKTKVVAGAMLGIVGASGVFAPEASAKELQGERIYYGLDQGEECEDGISPYQKWVLTVGGAMSTITMAELVVDGRTVGEFDQKGKGAFHFDADQWFGTEADIWADTNGNSGPGNAVLTISEGCYTLMPEEPVEEEPVVEEPTEEEPVVEEPTEEEPVVEEPETVLGPATSYERIEEVTTTPVDEEITIVTTTESATLPETGLDDTGAKIAFGLSLLALGGATLTATPSGSKRRKAIV